MKHKVFILSLALYLCSCSSKSVQEENDQSEQPPTPVTMTHGIYGNIEQNITFSATTAYLNKSVIASPISAYIAKTRVQKGTTVTTGQILYEIESKERHVIRRNSDNDLIPIRAASNGTIIDVMQQNGDYVTEGTVLCTIAGTESLVFEINVPYEHIKYVRSGNRFTIVLPDGKCLNATVQSQLSDMEAESQSVRVMARAQSPFLPEGMNVTAMFPMNKAYKAMLLPKGAVQSDGKLDKHWVMKLSDGRRAEKVNVEVTGRSAGEVEFLSDRLTPQDTIILDGSYGLEDGAEVIIIE